MNDKKKIYLFLPMKKKQSGSGQNSKKYVQRCIVGTIESKQQLSPPSSSKKMCEQTHSKKKKI